MRLRNLLYDREILKSTDFDIPIIAVGNLSLGGTGKTPHIEMLIRMLSSDYHLAVLSRGYGRKTHGFRWVDVGDQGVDVGDEPLQIKQNFKDVPVAVCENRVEGVIQMLSDDPKINLILMDDGFQHRAIDPYLKILLTTYDKPFFKDHIVPFGTLREARSGHLRANAVIVTKCPEKIETGEIENHIKTRPLFYSSIQYPEGEKKTVFGFSALADNSIFENYLKENYDLMGFEGFPDHYKFSKEDVKSLKAKAGSAGLICTAKDAVKLKDLEIEPQVVYIEHRIQKEEEFKNWIIKKLSEFES